MSFERELEADFQREVMGGLSKMMRKATVEVFTRVLMRSPVDLGRFRGNWQLSVGSPIETEIESFFGGAAGSGPDADEFAKLNPVLSELNRDADQQVWLTNNVPYAEVLEDGSSQQAPQGIVSISVMETEAALR